MTQRKPPSVTFDSWVDRQIREAQERGAFDDLPGVGKPIPDLDRPMTDLDMAAKIVRREQIDPSLFLPPSLTLPRELEDLRTRLASMPAEPTVRETVLDLNQRIREAHRRPQVGPPLLAMSVDVEQVVTTWREDRAELRRQYDLAHPTAAAPDPLVRRSWWRRRLLGK